MTGGIAGVVAASFTILVMAMFLYWAWHILVIGPRNVEEMRAKSERLKSERPTDTRGVFGSYFEAKGVSRLVWQEVFDFLQHQIPVEGFPVLPDDDLAEVYFLGTYNSMSEGLYELMRLCRRDIHDDEWPDSIMTVEDLVLILHRCHDVGRHVSEA